MTIEKELTTVKESVVESQDTNQGHVAQLIVHNDDINTFDWVIECLMTICKHSHQQAEQLSLIIHFKGKATVKTAPLKMLKPLKDTLIDKGLSVTIETF